jgi:hypothetical protein
LLLCPILFDDPLILLNLLLVVLILGFILSLHIISYERSRAESHAATDRGAQSRAAGGGTDEAARGGASNCADACAFFPRGQGAARTADSSEGSKAHCNHPSRRPKLIQILFHFASNLVLVDCT